MTAENPREITLLELIAELGHQGIGLETRGGELSAVSAFKPEPELLTILKAHKAELMAKLSHITPSGRAVFPTVTLQDQRGTVIIWHYEPTSKSPAEPKRAREEKGNTL
jgi:hypothetical protein